MVSGINLKRARKGFRETVRITKDFSEKTVRVSRKTAKKLSEENKKIQAQRKQFIKDNPQFLENARRIEKQGLLQVDNNFLNPKKRSRRSRKSNSLFS